MLRLSPPSPPNKMPTSMRQLLTYCRARPRSQRLIIPTSTVRHTAALWPLASSYFTFCGH